MRPIGALERIETCRVRRQHWRGHKLLCVVGIFSWLMIFSVAAADPKRVLIVHSFGNAAPPFTTHSMAFEAELTDLMGERVDIHEVSLDVARYATVDMEEAMLELMQKRQAQWQPQLVVPIGSPAGVFVAQYRDRLFPKSTPIIYTGMDQRRLPAGTLDQNASFVGESFHLPGLVEDILQIAPATTNIAVVIGASPLERYWTEVLQREYAPFTNRIQFTWFNDLSFDQMLERAARMPPRSFLLLVLLMRDATGVTHDANTALRRLHAVANAPINGIFQHQLGLGIVGGRLYQAELEGIESARIAVRVLRGEAVTNFPPLVIGPLEPRYDWRELQRWEIDSQHLPAGSTVLFREPTLWERYRWRIVLILSICAGQALLISLLLANLIKRRRAERSLAETEARFRAAADAAPVMIWMTGVDKLCTYVNKPWLLFTGRTLAQELGNGWLEAVHPDDRDTSLKNFIETFDARKPFFIECRLRRRDGEHRWFAITGQSRRDGQGNFIGYIGSCLDVTEARLKTEALFESEQRLRAILDTAAEGIITINEKGVIESVNASAEQVFGYSAGEMIGQNVALLMPAPFSKQHDQFLANYQRTQQARVIGGNRQVSGRRKDGSEFPAELAVSEIKMHDRRLFTGFVRDLTERQQAERAAREFGGRLLRAQEGERARLARELHDDITQRLARLAIDSGRAELAPSNAEGRVTMREVRDGLVSLSEDVHSLSYRLHPSLLEDLGLADALKAECERFTRQEGIAMEMNLGELPDGVPLDVGLCLFRVTQEALRNIIRHAQAREVRVSARRLEDGLQLAIQDNGVGFNPAQHRERPSLGLASMRERVRLVGGELEIESAPGQGTTILAWVPFDGANK